MVLIPKNDNFTVKHPKISLKWSKINIFFTFFAHQIIFLYFSIEVRVRKIFYRLLSIRSILRKRVLKNMLFLGKILIFSFFYEPYFFISKIEFFNGNFLCTGVERKDEIRLIYVIYVN